MAKLGVSGHRKAATTLAIGLPACVTRALPVAFGGHQSREQINGAASRSLAGIEHRVEDHKRGPGLVEPGDQVHKG
jgi:hypothetical protein